MTNLANARVIVTGGSAGVGLAIVRALAERGADLTAIARDPAGSARRATLAPGPSSVTPRTRLSSRAPLPGSILTCSSSTPEHACPW